MKVNEVFQRHIQGRCGRLVGWVTVELKGMDRRDEWPTGELDGKTEMCVLASYARHRCIRELLAL